MNHPIANPDPREVDQAFAHLRHYDHGSGRAGLLPLDQAVAAAETDLPARNRLEARLLTALKECSSSVAREYICSKLTRIGSKASVRALAELLSDPGLGLAARNALEAMASKPATKALRDGLPKVRGLQKTGVINSLGALRDAESVRALTRLLGDGDAEVARASVAALGNIGTVKAAKALQAWVARSPNALGQPAADAVLTCAERLRAEGRKPEARALYQLLAVPTQPAYIQAAAQRGLGA